MRHRPKIKHYDSPAGGWGSLHSLARFAVRGHVPAAATARQLMRHNKPDGYMCVSCAWAKPAQPHLFEFCENGAKATYWEMSSARAGPDFFAEHPLRELLTWADYDLELAGRLTQPLRYDAASDRYVPVAWDEAFTEIGRELKALDPKSAVFYTSGRASLETSYMYALMARLYGNNNLPDSSNMCHESTSVGLPRSIGVSVGTVRLEDFEHTDCIVSFGQNVGTCSPRMLHQLEEASERGVPIVTFNPLRERGWERFLNPQKPLPMLTGKSTRISSHYYQVKLGGDIAAMMGMSKALIEADDRAQADGAPRVLDAGFISEHTHGFDAFADAVRATAWRDIEHESGLARQQIEEAASVYAGAKAAMAVYGMGLTQHRLGVQNVRMLCNLLLLRGNIGKRGAGVCPVRGHSNVQGQRTVGITEKPELAPLDRLREQFGFEPPREKGLDTIGTVEGVLDGSVRAFVGLGGNFVRAAPETAKLEAAWRRLRLTVQVATKLNRSHLVCGEIAYLLPCLGRIERDAQRSGAQIVTMEDSTSCIHASRGDQRPASEHLLSEPKIVAEIAKAVLPPNPKVPWDEWVADYGRIRDAIEASYPEQFADFNRRMNRPGGFPRPNGARERRWDTDTGKANFLVPSALSATGFEDREGRLRLVTLRSNDQFNTTVYGYRDRFRGVEGTRRIVFMNRRDIERLGFVEGQAVSLVTDVDDGEERIVGGLRIVPYGIPEGCIGAYYPECNPLLPVAHHAEDSHVPAGKSIPVRVVRMQPNHPVPRGPEPY